MRWTGDLQRGAWIRDRLRGRSVLGGTVPRACPACASIFHPVDVQRLRNGRWEERRLTWATAARRGGRRRASGDAVDGDRRPRRRCGAARVLDGGPARVGHLE